MSSLAKMFNVSKVTISKALNDKEGVSEELRSRSKAAEEMGYRINNAARGLRTNKMYNIGLLIAERYMGKPILIISGSAEKWWQDLRN